MFDEFDNIAIRAFEPGFNVGDILPNSFVWVDGEIQDEELDGASGIRVRSEAEIAQKLAYVRSTYAFADRVIYIIGGNYASWGEDRGEIIIRNARVLRVIG
ncbi:MAG: hypothetical protein WC683_18330 [bacterium]